MFNFTENVKYAFTNNTFVTFVSDNLWYLGFLSQTFDELLEAEILILNRVAKNKYKYPEYEQKIVTGYNQILSEVSIESIDRKQQQFVVIKSFGSTKSKFEKYFQQK